MAVGAVVALLEFRVCSVLSPAGVYHVAGVPDEDVDVAGGVELLEFVEELDEGLLDGEVGRGDHLGLDLLAQILVLHHSRLLAPAQDVNLVLLELDAIPGVEGDLVLCCDDEGLLAHVPLKLLTNFLDVLVVH